MANEIQLKTKEHEKELISDAARMMGIGHSTFCKMVSIVEARKVLASNEADKFFQEIRPTDTILADDLQERQSHVTKQGFFRT